MAPVIDVVPGITAQRLPPGEAGYRDDASGALEIRIQAGSILRQTSHACAVLLATWPAFVWVAPYQWLWGWSVAVMVLPFVWGVLRALPRPGRLIVTSTGVVVEPRPARSSTEVTGIKGIRVSSVPRLDPKQWHIAAVLAGGNLTTLVRYLSHEQASQVGNLLAERLAVPMDDPTGQRPGWGRSLAIVAFILILGVWVVAAHWSLTSVARTVTFHRSTLQAASELLRGELGLKAMGVNRCAERLGRLPSSLQECEGEMPPTPEWIEWAEREQGETPEGLRRLPVEESWHCHECLNLATTPTPGGAQDMLGLPIRYVAGVSRPSGERVSWVSSSDMLPESVLDFSSDGEEARAAGKWRFLLGSLPLQRMIQEQRAHESDMRWAAGTGLAALGLFFLLGIPILIGWPGPRGKRERLLAVATTIVSGLGALGSVVMTATCYAMGGFTTARISKEERLAILDEAERKGEVPSDVAKAAREYIQGIEKPRYR